MKYHYYGKSLACLSVMLGCAVSGFAQVDVGTGKNAVTYPTLKEAVAKAETNKTIYSVTSFMAQVGDTKYASLADALGAITSEGTVTLLNDIDITSAKTKIAVGKDVTLDLNGHNVKAANSEDGNILVDGKLTLKDSKEGSTARIYTETNYKGGTYDKPVINIEGNGEFVMESGKITTVMENAGNCGQFGIGVWDKAKVTVKGGTIESGWYAIAGNGTQSQNANTTVNIEGGALISTADYAIYHPQNGTLTVTNGTVYGESGGIAMKRGELLMTGGTVTSKGLGSTGNWGDGTGNLKNAAIIVPATVNGDVKAVITGGKVTAEGDAVTIDAATSDKYTIDFAISGGTFSSDVSKYCVGDFSVDPNGDGTYTVTSYMAQVGDAKFASLAEALEAIATEGTVTLLNDIDITSAKTKIAVGKDVTLDLNGHNIKAANSEDGNILVDGKLTLKDSKEGSTARIYTETNYVYGTYDKPVINIEGNGEFVMESGKITTVMEDAGNCGQFGIGVWDKAKVTVKGGTIESGWYAIAGNGGASQNNANTTVNIEGGTLVSTADYAIYHPQNGTLTVSNGTVYGEAGGIAMKRGELLMTGGTVTSKGLGSTGNWGDGTGNLKNAAIIVPATVYGDVKAAITGGKVTAEGDAVTIEAATSDKYTIDFTISGGTFSSDVSAYCADNYTAAPNGDGTYGIVTGDVIVVTDDGSVVAEAGKDLEISASTISKWLVNSELAGVNVKMTKTFSTTNWSSFYVPFAITLTDKLLQDYDFAKVWDTEFVNDEVTLEFKKLSAGDVIAANTPCLIKAKAEGEHVLEFPAITFKQPTKVTDCSTTEQKFTFHGTLEKTTLQDKYGYFLNPAAQQFQSASSATKYLRPCGFYMTIQDRETGAWVYPSAEGQTKAFAFRVLGDEEVTGITEVDKSAVETKAGKIYTLQGVFVGTDADRLPNGVYVINGKKVVVK